jgi:hypothetical protein
MTDTQRTPPELAALLPDNQERRISAQDVRDLVASLRPGFAAMTVTTPAATSPQAAGVPLKAAGTTALAQGAQAWTMPESNRLQYEGRVRRAVILTAAVSLTAGANNILTKVVFAKNGTPIAGEAIPRFVGTGADVGAVPVVAFTDASATDYFELFVSNETNTATVTIEAAVVTALDLFAD